MKVLLLFPMQDGQTGPAIKYAFEQLGHKVMAVNTINAKVSKCYKACCEFKPDLVFCSKGSQLIEDVTTIKKWFKNITICMWNVDTKATVKAWKRLFPLIELCDYYFDVNDYHIVEWNKKFRAKAIWLSQGLQDEVYDKPKKITDGDSERYCCDVSFAGTCRKKASWKWRRDIFDAIRETGASLKTWGSSGYPKVWNENHNKMVSLSKINLGMSRLHGNKVRKSISVRNYKVMGAGGFLLELYHSGIEDIFPLNGQDRILDCYASPEEAAEKVQYWLTNEEERKEIAERAYKWVHEKATYTHRIRKALKIMGL